MKNTLKSWFLSEIPLSSLNFESNIFIWRACLEFYFTVIRTLGSLQVILRSFLFVKQLRIKNIEFISLNCFWRRIIVIIVLSIVFIPLNCDSSSVDVLRLFVSKSSFSFTWYPIIELFFIFLKTFIFLKLDNLLSDEIDSHSWVIYNGSTQ